MEEKVKEIFEKQFKMEIDDGFDKNSTEKWDSFAHLDLMVALEEAFNVSFTPNEMGSISSYSDVINILKQKC